jgi:hypothetical protein
VTPASLIRCAATAAVRCADWLLSPRAATTTARATLPADALWALSGRDVSGPVAVSLWPLPCGRLGLTLVADGHLTGLRLTREDAQQLRHSVTGWLVNAAPAVTE